MLGRLARRRPRASAQTAIESLAKSENALALAPSPPPALLCFLGSVGRSVGRSVGGPLPSLAWPNNIAGKKKIALQPGGRWMGADRRAAGSPGALRSRRRPSNARARRAHLHPNPKHSNRNRAGSISGPARGICAGPPGWPAGASASDAPLPAYPAPHPPRRTPARGARRSSARGSGNTSTPAQGSGKEAHPQSINRSKHSTHMLLLLHAAAAAGSSPPSSQPARPASLLLAWDRGWGWGSRVGAGVEARRARV